MQAYHERPKIHSVELKKEACATTGSKVNIGRPSLSSLCCRARHNWSKRRGRDYGGKKTGEGGGGGGDLSWLRQWPSHGPCTQGGQNLLASISSIHDDVILISKDPCWYLNKRKIDTSLMDHVVHDLRFDDWRKTLPGPATAPNAKMLVREAFRRRAGEYPLSNFCSLFWKRSNMPICIKCIILRRISS